MTTIAVHPMDYEDARVAFEGPAERAARRKEAKRAAKRQRKQEQEQRAAIQPTRPVLLSQRLEQSLGAEAPRSSLRPLAWQSAMRKLWEQAEEAKREAT